MSAIDLATVATPFIALGGGIWLFFLKASQDRSDQLRKERIPLYREYLSLLQSHSNEDHDELVAHGLSLVTKISPIHDQISLMAPDDVAQASLVMINANIGGHLWSDGKRIVSMSKLGPKATGQELMQALAASEPYREARKNLIRAMRKDIVEGSRIDPILTDVEDLKK